MNILSGIQLIYFLEEVFKARRLKDIKASKIFTQFAYFSNGTEAQGVYFPKNEMNNILAKLKR